MRAADCKKLAEKTEGLFRQVKQATELLRRLFAYAVIAAAFSGFMGARVEMACL